MGHINFRKENLTTADVLDYIESESAEDVPDTIYIQPPIDTGDDSDAESGDEDDILDCNINRLNKNQLESQAEVEYNNEDVESNEEEITTKRKTTKKKKLRNWKKLSNELPDLLSMSEDIVFAPPLTFGPTSEPIEFFDLYLTPDIINDFVIFTNNYAIQKSSNLVVDKNDIYSFIGILLLTG